jgi:inner membrane protein
MKFALLGRLATIAAVAVAILVPIHMIEGKIAERQATAEGVVQGFASETSGPQVVAGPFLALSCEETVMVERQVMHEGKAQTISEPRTNTCPTAFFTPRTFGAAANAPVESLHRGLYAIRLYRAELTLDGAFEWPEPPPTEGAIRREWMQAWLVTYVKDPRGIKALASATAPAKGAPPTVRAIERFAIREPLGSWSGRKPGTPVEFSYRLTLAGTSSFGIAPVGGANDVRITSTWPHPSFGTSWSPDERSINAAGFDARWRMTAEATGGEARWRQRLAKEPLEIPDAGVTLYDPVNVYLLAYRATEYAFLFVLFTFAALALAELLAGIRLHAMQYALVGSAIAIFFLLLIALSEHYPFRESYAGSAAACVGLLTWYLRHPLGTWLRAALFFALFVSLYGSLYVLLQSEDNALLLGSLMTFAVLAFAMIATRKLDWGAVSRGFLSPSRKAPA